MDWYLSWGGGGEGEGGGSDTPSGFMLQTP